MPSRGWRMWIDDILEAIAKIERYAHGLDMEEWKEDEKTVDAVIRNLEVIGEASSRLPAEAKERYAGVPWSMVKGIRVIS